MTYEFPRSAENELETGRRGVSDAAVADLAVVEDGRQLVVNGEQLLARFAAQVGNLQDNFICLRCDVDRLNKAHKL